MLHRIIANNDVRLLAAKRLWTSLLWIGLQNNMERLSKVKGRLLRKIKEKPDGGAEQGGVFSSSPTPTPTPTGPTSLLAPAAPALRPAKPSSITTVAAQLPPEQAAPSVAQLPNPAPTLPASAPLSSQPTDSDTISPPTSNGIDPWTLAYEIFQEREPGLVSDYKEHLASRQGDAAVSADLSSRQSVEAIVNELLETREKKQWRVSILGNDVKIREQAEKLAKFLQWADQVVKTAASAQPYAALAWSGVSLVLPVGE